MRAFKITSVVFLLLGAGMLYGGLHLYRTTQEFVAGAATASGTVVELDRRTSNNGDYTYAPVVEFSTPDGKDFRFVSSASSSPPAFARGEVVRVLYTPANPAEARIDSFGQLWAGGLILAGLGATFFLAGFGIHYYFWRRGRTQADLKAHGRSVLADIESVSLDSSVTLNGRHPYRILAQWQDPTTAKIHLFHSDNLWFNPEKYIERKQLTVYLDLANPKKYYVDVSFLPQVEN